MFIKKRLKKERKKEIKIEKNMNPKQKQGSTRPMDLTT
jgi:hypothetical protein